MSQFIEKMREYGADIEGVTDRLGDDEEFYIECLNAFNKDENFQGLVDNIHDQKYQEAFDCAHALKGVSANLGLTPLYNSISNITEALRAHDYSDVDNLLEKVTEERTKFTSLL